MTIPKKLNIPKEERFWEVIDILKSFGIEVKTRITEFGVYFDIPNCGWSCEQIFNDCSYNNSLIFLEGILYGVKLKTER